MKISGEIKTEVKNHGTLKFWFVRSRSYIYFEVSYR